MVGTRGFWSLAHGSAVSALHGCWSEFGEVRVWDSGWAQVGY